MVAQPANKTNPESKKQPKTQRTRPTQNPSISDFLNKIMKIGGVNYAKQLLQAYRGGLGEYGESRFAFRLFLFVVDFLDFLFKFLYFFSVTQRFLAISSLFKAT
jgi:hypothetical protein